MKIKITQEDLDKALAVPWSNTTCLVAQAIMRATGLRKLHDLLPGVGSMNPGEHRFIVDGEGSAQMAFDTYKEKTFNEPTTLDDVKAFIGTEFEISAFNGGDIQQVIMEAKSAQDCPSAPHPEA